MVDAHKLYKSATLFAQPEDQVAHGYNQDKFEQA